jgi:hypothetical protein
MAKMVTDHGYSWQVLTTKNVVLGALEICQVLVTRIREYTYSQVFSRVYPFESRVTRSRDQPYPAVPEPKPTVRPFGLVSPLTC